MAFCIAHTTAGYLAYEAVRPAGRHRPLLLATAVALANAPDFDFFPGIALGLPGVYHRGVTHTIAAVALVAVAGWTIGRALAPRLARVDWPARRAGLWAGAVYGSHLLLDFVTIDARPPEGARFLWPLSDAYYLAPVTVLGEIIIDPSGRLAFFRSLVTAQTLGVWLGEAAFLACTIAAVHGLRLTLTGAPARVRGIADGS
jgi:membrane-bound metal-dependent hydrolase YbcI (DUF457 family)